MLTSGIVKRCLKEIEKSNNPNYKFGAVIFKNGRIINSGHNQFRSSSIPRKYKKFEDSLHAEQAAILGIDWGILKNASILVMKTNRSGNFSISFPCSYCYNSLKYVGVKWIFYTNRKGEIMKEKIKNEFK